MTDYEQEAWGARLGAALREATPDPALDDRIMAAIRRAPGVDLSRRPGRVWRVLAFAAGIAAVFVLGRMTARPVAARGPDPGPSAANQPLVRFVVRAPGARQVSLVGDFNDWNQEATPLAQESAPGVWTVEIPLASGRHEYAFVVDGSAWLPDPAAPQVADADFGRPNSVILVSSRGL